MYYLFVATGLFDLWSTIECCGSFPGYEENPVLRAPWELFGIWGLVGGKLLGIGLVVTLTVLAKRRYGTRLVEIPLVLGIVTQTIAALTNMAWIPYEISQYVFFWLN